LRYATISADQVSAAPPSEADIARSISERGKLRRGREAASWPRSCCLMQAQAQVFAAKVKAGTSFAKAAAAAGFGCRDIELGDQTRRRSPI